MILLLMLIFISALLVTRLVGRRCCFGDKVFNDANWGDDAEDPEFYVGHFGTLPRSMFTLFQFTMEFQPDICRSTWHDGTEGYLFTAFLILYTMLSNLALLNIMASIIVEVIMTISASNHKEEKAIEKQ